MDVRKLWVNKRFVLLHLFHSDKVKSLICANNLFNPLLKVTLLHGCFSRFLNYTDGTKSRKTSQISFCA